MKVLKILAFLLGIILIAGLILNYISPNDVHIHQSVEIDADSDVVFDQVSHLQKMGEWQPWLRVDPTTVVTLTGTDGQVGAISSWKSDHKNVGVGEQEITLVDPNKRVETALRFKAPYESESTSYIDLDDVNGKVKVTWGMETTATFPNNIIMKFMATTLNEQFADGLGNLKKTCEGIKPVEKNEMPKSKGVYAFEVQELEATKYLIKREKIDMKDLSSFFQGNMPQIYTALMANGGEPVGFPSALFYEWDYEGGKVDLAVALKVAKDLNIEGYAMHNQKAGMIIKTSYFGPYEGGEDAHYAMDNYMKENGYLFDGMVIEEYVNDPTTVSDPSKIQTDIIYYVKKKIS